MKTLGKALDKISYEWLLEAHPDLAEAIESEVEEGADPADIKWFVLRHTQRHELALRCEQAARHLVLEYEENDEEATVTQNNVLTAGNTGEWHQL